MALTPLASGTAQGGDASEITLAAGESATDDLHNGNVISLVSGTGAGQARLITDYDGTTKVATVSPEWTVVGERPDATTGYEITHGFTNVMNQLVAQNIDTNTNGFVLNRANGFFGRMINDGHNHLSKKPLGGIFKETSSLTFSGTITGTGSIDIDGVYWSSGNNTSSPVLTKEDDLWTVDNSGVTQDWSGGETYLDAIRVQIDGGDEGTPSGLLTFTIKDYYGNWEYLIHTKVPAIDAGDSYDGIIGNDGNLSHEGIESSAVQQIPSSTWTSIIESTGSITAEQILRAVLAFVAGDRAGGGTATISFKRADGSTNAILMESVDTNGNTTSITLDLD